MPHHKNDGQGQSLATEGKKRGLSVFFDEQLRIFHYFNQKQGTDYRYFHFDLHAGEGYNHEVGVIGSPLVFLSEADKWQVRYGLYCAEHDETRARTLARKLSDVDDAYVFHGNNYELVEMIPDIVSDQENPKYALGSILLDPNSPNDGIPWTTLAEATRRCPRLDVVFNFPAGHMKRCERSFGEKGCVVPLEKLPLKLNRPYWQLRHVEDYNPHQFCLCVGRSMANSPMKFAHYVDWGSEEGIRIRAKLKFSKAEYSEWLSDRQRRLEFDDISNI